MDKMTELILVLDRYWQAGLGDLFKHDNYYEGEQPLKYMSQAMKEELGPTVAELVLNWARLVGDAYENRLDVEGFRYLSQKREDTLWSCWQANNMDEQSQQAHLDSVVLGRSYVTVGSNPDGPFPLVTVESPFQMWAQREPGTRRVTAAIKRWHDPQYNVPVPNQQHAIVYTPEWTRWFVWEGGGWKQTYSDDHNFGIVPVVPLVNRPRLMRPDGTSELADVIPIADAANKMATDMMISGEYHAMPRRWAFGLKQSDFMDKNGRPMSTWSAIKGRLWANENKDISVGQFSEADLTNFHNTIRLLAQVTAQMAALPPHYMAFAGQNPISADAIDAAESQLVKRVERKHTFLGGAWEDVQRLVLMFMSGSTTLPDEAQAIETLWRDPSTPTVAQMADATVKKYGSGLIPREQARIDLGYTDKERDQMREWDAEDQARRAAEAPAPVIPAVVPSQSSPSN